MKKIEAAKTASAASGSNNDNTAGGSTASKTPVKKSSGTPKTKTPKATKLKSEPVVKAEESGNDADAEKNTKTPAGDMMATVTKENAPKSAGKDADMGGSSATPTIGKNAVFMKKNSRKAADNDAEDEASGDVALVKPAAKRVRTKKEPEYDADGNLVKPVRKAPAPKLDDNGIPVTPKRKPAAPKLDENGNPVTPKPRVRKPKDTNTTTDGSANVETPSPKKGRKTKAQLAAERGAAAAKEAAEKVQDEGLLAKVDSVFAGKAMTPAADLGSDSVFGVTNDFAVVVHSGHVQGAGGNAIVVDEEEEEDGEVTEEMEDGAPITPVSTQKVQAEEEDYTLTLGEEV